MVDIYECIKPTLIVSKFIGLAPYYVESDTRTLKISKLGLFISFAMLLIYGGTSGWVLYDLLFDVDGDHEQGTLFKDYGIKKKGDDIAEVNKKCQVACGVGVTILTILLTILQRNKVVQMVNQLNEINRQMRTLRIVVPYDKIGRHSVIGLVFLVIFVVAVAIHAVFVWLEQSKSYNLPGWITSLAPPLFYFIMEFQFIAAALLLKKHFVLLNEYLAIFTAENKGRPAVGKEMTETYVDGNDIFLGPKLIDTSFIAWDGNFAQFAPNKGNPGHQTDKNVQLANIKVFRKIHSGLCDVKDILNSAYSVQLLAAVAQAFVIITSDLYLLFTSVSDTGLTQIAWLTYPVVWTVNHVLELIFVVITCTRTSKTANQTAVVVHKLLAKDCEPELRNQLKLFSIQLLHRKMSFSACGFFTLDMTLLQAIIGAATTYLVILIQFHLGQKPE